MHITHMLTYDSQPHTHFLMLTRPSRHTEAPPVIAVGELHVHAVAAEEGLAVQRDVHVGWVLDGLTHDNETGQRLLVPAQTAVRGAAAIHLDLARAVQNLPRLEFRRGP